MFAVALYHWFFPGQARRCVVSAYACERKSRLMASEEKRSPGGALDAIRGEYLSHGDAFPVLKGRTAQVDDAVIAAYSSTLGCVMNGGVAITAVGGYGRKELFPHSDIDILILVKKPPDRGPEKDALSAFLRLLWDGGYRVSQSVRPVEECCTITEGNFELTVSLLDHRLLAGDSVLYGQLQERFGKFLAAEKREVVKRLCRMARSRHAKFHNTIYRLEPDLKEHPGGLRDLQTIRWLRPFRETEPEAGLDLRAKGFFYSVRCFLHYRANRDSNVLNFEAQDELAHAPFSRTSDPAQWMEDYFRHASSIWRAANAEMEISESLERSLLANFRDWRSRLSNSEFTVSRDRILLRNPGDLVGDPDLVLRLFLFRARHGVTLAVDTEQRLKDHLAQINPGLGHPRPLAAFWKELASLPHFVDALREMHETGVLAALIPEWERIEHRVTRDFYHQYTVDEHTLVTLDVLANLPLQKEASERRFGELHAESKDLHWMLFLALLLHDIGKGSGKDHSVASVALAREVVARMGVEETARDLILFLIEHHLALSSLMQTRDLNDPATARLAAGKVKTIERLRLLTLMTYADISAVNPTAMSPWRKEQLWRLYRVAARELTGALTGEGTESAPEEAYGKVGPQMREFLEGLPSRYVWTHTAEQAEAHSALYERAKQSGYALEIVRREGIYRLSVAAPDRPFLFASIAGGLASFGLNIVKAEAYSNKHGYIVDGFAFSDPGRSLELNPPEMERLKMILGRVVTGEARPEDLLKYRPKRSAPSKLGAIKPSVSCDREMSAVASVYEVIAQDRPGLLFDLAAAISRAGCNIEVVLVDTEAHKAIDVFHVSKGGSKLSSQDLEALRAALLEAC